MQMYEKDCLNHGWPRNKGLHRWISL